jgi:hygromycin-B 4-O-kinase
LDDYFLKGWIYRKEKMMKTQYNTRQIHMLIHKHYPDAADIQALSGGLVSQTYAFKSKEKFCIFQLGGKEEDYQKEQYVSRLYADILPVRRVRELYRTPNGNACCFSDYIEGRKLFDTDAAALAGMVPEILSVLEKIAAAPVPARAGYGRFDASGHAPFACWPDFIASVCDRSRYDWGAFMDGCCEVVEAALQILERNLSCIDEVSPHLVHGDIGSYNLLAEDGHISGVIDWNYALFGDPLFELANIIFWNEDKLYPLVRTLQEKYSPQRGLYRRLHLYALRIGLEEAYNTALPGQIGYDEDWVIQRIGQLVGIFKSI